MGQKTFIDGEVVDVKPGQVIRDVVPSSVPYVTSDTGETITRSQFSSTPVPSGVTTAVSEIDKG